MVTQFNDYHPSKFPKYYNKDKGKGRLVNDEDAIDIAKQNSIVINNAYEHNPGWSKE